MTTDVEWPEALRRWAQLVQTQSPHPSARAIALAAAEARIAAEAHWRLTGEGLLRDAARRTCPWVGVWAWRERPEDGTRALKTGGCPWCGLSWRSHR
jgi:hypothetical protein